MAKRPEQVSPTSPFLRPLTREELEQAEPQELGVTDEQGNWIKPNGK